ncbi:MAG: OmpA family protein [Rhodocyclaceae bacterium]|nr:OmpA family protein [Rhodocyclaceae bacterium]MDZ4214007.1 OmpA family protein [Rhodocyclaceae bacterium]
MTNTFNVKQVGRAVSCALAALALGFVSGAASAQISPTTTGYLTDQRGVVAKSGHGLCWRTGYWTQAMAIAECDPDLMPKPVAATDPSPQPAVAMAPVARVTERTTQRVTFDADALFDFDKATLRPAGRAKLDEFSDKLSSISLEGITAIGHTDRFGSEAYNQLLSERRAESVKSYLVGRGIEPNRITTEGRGETQPVTPAGQCLGPRNAKVVACLQPDRRVDVELTGHQVSSR